MIRHDRPRARRLLCALLLFLFAAAGAFSQAMDFTAPDETGDAAGAAAAGVDERLQIAIADPRYPVTPGDVYNLTFLQGIELVTSQVLVESDYNINLGVLGEVSGRGKTFAQLKPEIEAIIAAAYPRSLPSVTIAAVGVFEVLLSGAIPQARRVTMWGLSRLSDVVSGVTGPYTSLRRVTVVSASRREQSYDIFRAISQGASEEDPLLKPGDSVVFHRRNMVVGVRGEVYEPGSYELLSGERLPELRQFFQGFTPNADLGRLVVTRQGVDGVQQLQLGTISQAERFTLRNGDVLTVPARVIPRPVVFIEGAVDIEFSVQVEADEQSLVPVYNRITRELTVGDTLYSLLLDIQDQISPFGDIDRGYIIRDEVDEPFLINMREVLYRQSEYNDFVLEPFDRIVIPLDQPYVVVSGDVEAPARYPYNPSADYAYYINLAGTGAELFLDVRNRVRIYDRDGAEQDIDATIHPGYIIHVADQPENIVVVSGDVPDPGAYPHLPSRELSAYLRLAGVGAESFDAVLDSVEIYDESGTPADGDVTIQPDYTVYVPPAATPDGEFVLVTGAVNAPGLYEYIEERTARHYIQQAAGVDTEVSANGSYTVRSPSGERRAADAAISPGDTIEVDRNGFVYNFNRYFPIITTGLTFITTIITLVNALNP